MNETNIVDNSKIRRYRQYMKMLIQGFVKSLICQSRAGLGKTQTTIKILQDEEEDFHYINTYSTPLALYKTMYEHNGKTIVLDDMEMILNNDITISILKSALWDVQGKRIVTYHSNTHKLENVPQSFVFTGKILMLVNEIKVKKSPSFDALLSRTLNIDITYSFEETKAMAFDIINQREPDAQIRMRLMDIINRRILPHHDFNFRLLDRLIQFVKFDENSAEELFMASFSVDEDYKIVWELINNKDLSRIDQIRMFQNKTGKGRATFYRLIKRINEEYGQ